MAGCTVSQGRKEVSEGAENMLFLDSCSMKRDNLEVIGK